MNSRKLYASAFSALALLACQSTPKEPATNEVEESAMTLARRSEAEGRGGSPRAGHRNGAAGQPIATLADDVRFHRSLCGLSGQVDANGDCLPGAIHPEIYFGSAPSGRDQFGSTVALHIEGADSTGYVHESICSGSLIAPSFVLSARHCVEWMEVPVGGVYENVPMEITEAVFGLHNDPSEDPLQKRIQVDRCYEFDSTTSVKCSRSTAQPTDRDLILIHLATPAPVVPMPIAPDSWIDRATYLVAVGFGRTEEQGPNNEREIGRKLYAQVPMVSPSCSGFKNGRSDEEQYGCIPGLELVAGLGEHQGAPAEDTCSGDSGGTIFLIEQPAGGGSGSPRWPDDYFLAAATSRAISGYGANPVWPYCGDGGVYVRTDGPVKSWLQRVALSSGERIVVGR